MPHDQPSSVVLAIQRFVSIPGADVTLTTSLFNVSYAVGSGRLTLNVCKTTDEARQRFATDGGRFFVPRLSSYWTALDGTITGWTPPPPVPPILSSESIVGIGDENRVWNGYGRTKRGVIKMRVGRFLANMDVPTLKDAEALARQVAEALRVE
jgi:hypothetical protein